MKTSAFAVLSKRQSKTSGQELIRTGFQNPRCLQKRDSMAIHFSPRLSTKEKLHRNEVSLHLSTSYQSWQLLQRPTSASEHALGTAHASRLQSPWQNWPQTTSAAWRGPAWPFTSTPALDQRWARMKAGSYLPEEGDTNIDTRTKM